MKPARKLWQLTVVGTADTAEPIVELLQPLLGGTPWIVEDFERRTVNIHTLLERQPAPADPPLRDLPAGLDRIGRRAGTNLPLRWFIRPLRQRDWAESWKRHFPATVIDRRLLLRPPWSRRRARPGQSVLVLNPGLSFGTGHHATTRFCLRQVVAASRLPRPRAMLDVGTGSGILAIAAAKLGFTPVEALDFDPTAVRVALVNARRNRVAGRVAIREEDALRLPLRPRRRFELICANLTSDLLLAGRDRILGSLHRGGWLVLAGVLVSQFDAVRQAYADRGCRLEADTTEGEWRSGRFER